MNGTDRQRRMQQMAAMVFEARAADLRQAADRCAALRRQIVDLDRSTDPVATDPATAPVFFAYESWAAARRVEINMELARAQADWTARLDATRLAFARQSVLDRLASRRR